MAIIYMKHPVHGEKVAVLEQEAEYDEREGWTRYTPGVEDDPDDEPTQPVNALGRRRRKEVHNGYHGG